MPARAVVRATKSSGVRYLAVEGMIRVIIGAMAESRFIRFCAIL